MAFENLKAAITALMDEIVARPEDHHVLQEQLREKLAELEALGLPVPDDLKDLVALLADEEAGDLFDNMPV